MLKDIFNRELKIGDMVLYVRNKIEYPLNYGLVLSDKTVFDGKCKYHYAEDCILVTNFDELENIKYKELVESYNLFELARQKKKFRNLEQKEHIKYGLYRDGKRYFIYLGKMYYSDDFILNSKINNKYPHYYGNTEGYAYFRFVDSYSSNRILNNVLNSRNFNIIEALYFKDSIGIISPRISSIGYSYINLSKKVIPYDEYLGQVNLLGITNKGSIYLYDELLKIYGDNFEIDSNNEDYYNIFKSCKLIDNI